MPIIRIKATKCNAEPQDYEVPEGYLPEHVHGLAKLYEGNYKRANFQTAIEFIGMEEAPALVKEFITTQNINQVALTLIDPEKERAIEAADLALDQEKGA